MIFIENFWEYVSSSAPFFLFGLIIGGFLKVYISVDRVNKSLGGKSISSVLKAALIGIPMPLCSCSLIPTAVTLKKSGASNASTSAFLISTPESGVDSIAITYAMMDLPMTIIRPVAAFLSSMIAGVLQLIFNHEEESDAQEIEEVKSCCSSKKQKVEKSENSLLKAIRFSFGDLIDDISFWLFIGFVIGAIIETFIPANFFQHLNGFGGKLIIMGVGIPLYICASSSTPMAASLVMKGMSPGTALILLLAGPATNMSNLLVLKKYIGKKGLLINLFAVIIVTLVLFLR